MFEDFVVNKVQNETGTRAHQARASRQSGSSSTQIKPTAPLRPATAASPAIFRSFLCRTFMAKYREGGLGMREEDISVPAVAADFEFLTSDRVEQDVMPGVAAGAIEFSVTYGMCHAVCS